ncbi:MAG TPA: hypothetical protein VNC22_20395 [Sporichthya sp.]|nr:hypothetical protein [Sporichthya sp.]
MALTTVPSAGAKLRASVFQSLMAERMPLIARKTTNETVNNSSTLQNDDEIFLAVEASCVYHFELRISSDSGTTPDLKLGFTYPTGTTIRWSGVDADTAGAVRITGGLTETSVPAVVGGTPSVFASYYSGVVITGVNAGTLQLQWAQNSANLSNSIVQAGSYLLLQRVA